MKKINLSLFVLTIGIMSLGELQARTISWCKRQDGSVFNTNTEERTCTSWGNVTELPAAQIACMNAAFPTGPHNMMAGEFELVANPSGQKCSEITTESVADNDEDDTRENTETVANVYCRKADGSFEQRPQNQLGDDCQQVTDTTLIACFDSAAQNNVDPVQGCHQQISAAYPAATPGTQTGGNPTPGQVGQAAVAATTLKQLACNGTVASAERSPQSELSVWSGNAYPNARDILASQSRSGSSRRSSRASDDFEDYEDFAESKDFRKAPLLLFCEAQGPEAWSVFSEKLGGAQVDGDHKALWDGSWKKLFLNLQDMNATFTQDEIAYLNECKAGESLFSSQSTQAQALVTKLKTAISEGIEKIAVHRRKLEKCEALVFLTDIADYDKEYEGTGRSGITTKASVDGKVSCKTYGPEAQDFKKCSEFVNAYDASMVAKTALNAGQQIHYQGESMDRQAELQRQGSTGGIDHRGALGAQKSDIKDRANYATQNAALDSAKLATLFAMLQSMPNRAKLAEHCDEGLATNKDKALQRLKDGHNRTIDNFIAGFGIDRTKAKEFTTEAGVSVSQANLYAETDVFMTVSTDTDNREGGSSLCSVTARNRAAQTLIMNTEMRSQAKQILAQTAIEAAASFAAAGMLNKQARQIDDLLKRIEGYDPSEDFVAPTADLMAGPCAFDPTQEGCSGEISGTDRAVGFGDTSLSFSAGGFGSSGTQLGADEGFENAAGSGNGGADRSGASTPVGSIIPTVDKKSGFQDPAVAAARVKSGAGQRGGGGGGGGASAIGSTGGGGGGGSTGQARGGQATGGKQLAYAGSSIGRLSGGRGVGRKPASKDGAGNPFANMFKKGAPGNATLNFRGPAGIGGKSGNIFDQISSRYQVVQTKNRLLEYEEKKK